MAKVGYVKKLDKGKYLLRLSLGFDEFGKRIQPSRVVYAKSDRDAETQLMSFYGERDKLLKERTTRVVKTLEDLYNEWIKNHVEANLRDDTAAYYKGLWKNYLQQYCKAKIKTFSPKMVNNIIGKLEKGSRTRKAVYGMLKAMFNKAKKWEFMTDNPCDRVDTPKYKAEIKEVYTSEELTYIMELVEKEDVKFQAIFYFAILCGLRRGEIVGLKWDDINFKNMYFEVKRSATSKKGIGTTTDKPKNFTSERKLELPMTLVPILKSIRAQQAKEKMLLGEKWIDSGFIFTRRGGKIMGQNAPDYWLKRMRDTYPKFPQGKTLHTFRHTMATDMIINGAPISAVSGALGHAQQTTTLNIYSHVIQDAKKTVLQNHEAAIMSLKKKSVQ